MAVLKLGRLCESIPWIQSNSQPCPYVIGRKPSLNYLTGLKFVGNQSNRAISKGFKGFSGIIPSRLSNFRHSKQPTNYHRGNLAFPSTQFRALEKARKSDFVEILGNWSQEFWVYGSIRKGARIYESELKLTLVEDWSKR